MSFQSKLSKLLLAPCAVIRTFRDFIGATETEAKTAT